jgi:hypothetical protein
MALFFAKVLERERERERERGRDDRIQRGDILLVGRWGDFHFIKNVFTSCFQNFVHIH